MDILLINPPGPSPFNREGRCMQKSGMWSTPWPPLTLCLCASLLIREGFSVKVLDCPAEGRSLADLVNIVSESRPSLAVLSTGTPSIESDLEALRAVKSCSPGTGSAVLGIHATVYAGEILDREPLVDFTVLGEPEMTLRDLALAVREGRTPEGVKGLAFRAGDSVVLNDRREWLEDLDSIGPPAWQCLDDPRRYRLPISSRPFLSIFSARGCPYGCTFCADHVYYGRKVRTRSASSIVDEMELAIRDFNVRDFLFWTESFTSQRDLVMAISGEIRRRSLQVRWYCNSRVDSLDLDLAKAMKESGCAMISFGIESFDADVLASVKKGTTTEQAEDAICTAHQCGIEVIAHCIFGLPGETEDGVRTTIRKICSLPVDYAQFYAAVPFPGTALYDQACEKGWIRLEYRDWKYFEQSFCILDGDHLSAAQVGRLREEAYRAFYFRPRFLMGLAAKILREGGASAISALLKDFLRLKRFWA
jgi:radical SAM superfamily enzyme YgiQ (UPF0313 family)